MIRFCPHCGERLPGDENSPPPTPRRPAPANAAPDPAAFKRKLVTVKAFAKANCFTENQVRWMIFNSASNRLDKYGAIVRIGRRVYLDVDALEKWARE